MEVIGSEIGQKMRSAIKAKLTELGCYVDDELPDYVMVMVANKRTRSQMEDDLQLFLGDNTELFVNWLHQVLKKLQEVTVTAPIKQPELDKSKDKSAEKDRKSKDKKEKLKKSDSNKKAKKKSKRKHHRKEERKIHKSKKKSKHHEIIRPNIPPLLMNMEKESEPSITDVFAGQILKNHGITIDTPKDDSNVIDKKPVINESKRPIIPIIDPATISSQTESTVLNVESKQDDHLTTTSLPSTELPRKEQLKEINEIEAKIQGLKQKLAEQLDSMSDDEDFLNIRTEAEELMNDFAEDVFQEISQPPPKTPPPLETHKSPVKTQLGKVIEQPIEIPKEPPEILPQIELNLPKRLVRKRLGAREEIQKTTQEEEKEPTPKGIVSPERFTPEREPICLPESKSRNRVVDMPEKQRKTSINLDDLSKSEASSKKITSKVSVLENRTHRATCASVVRVRPRPRVSAPSLLLRAVADAHKSLLNTPPKVNPEPQKVKRALVLPMRRCVDPQKIVIQVPGDTHRESERRVDYSSEAMEMESYDKNMRTVTDVVKREDTIGLVSNKVGSNETTTARKDETLVVETINIHHQTVDKEKNTQFIVTMDGFNPNAFLAKKLRTEGILEDEEEISQKTTKESRVKKETKDKSLDTPKDETLEKVDQLETKDNGETILNKQNRNEKKNSQVTVKDKEQKTQTVEKANVMETIRDNIKSVEKRKSNETDEKLHFPAPKKRKASPIVFNVAEEQKPQEEKNDKTDRERTNSVSSDSHVTVTTTAPSNKYDAVPALTAAEKKLVWCRAFPLCRFGAACAYAHPRCKFAASCTRRNCVYSHAPNTGPTSPLPNTPIVASHVVPVATFKTLAPVSVPAMCKYYPNCVNPACHFYHPKPCRYGKYCLNKLECNFYHSDVPAGKWKYPV